MRSLGVLYAQEDEENVKGFLEACPATIRLKPVTRGAGDWARTLSDCDTVVILISEAFFRSGVHRLAEGVRGMGKQLIPVSLDTLRSEERVADAQELIHQRFYEMLPIGEPPVLKWQSQTRAWRAVWRELTLMDVDVTPVSAPLFPPEQLKAAWRQVDEQGFSDVLSKRKTSFTYGYLGGNLYLTEGWLVEGEEGKQRHDKEGNRMGSGMGTWTGQAIHVGDQTLGVMPNFADGFAVIANPSRMAPKEFRGVLFRQGYPEEAISSGDVGRLPAGGKFLACICITRKDGVILMPGVMRGSMFGLWGPISFGPRVEGTFPGLFIGDSVTWHQLKYLKAGWVGELTSKLGNAGEEEMRSGQLRNSSTFSGYMVVDLR